MFAEDLKGRLPISVRRTGSRRSPREIDQHDIRILPHAIEQNLAAIGSNVEAAHGVAGLELRQAALCAGAKIQFPKVLRAKIAL